MVNNVQAMSSALCMWALLRGQALRVAIVAVSLFLFIPIQTCSGSG